VLSPALILTTFLVAAASPQAVAEKERGDRLAANGDFAAAQEAYHNAEKLSPGYAEAINQLGFLFARQGKFDESLGHFQRAIAADARFALAHYNLGFVLRKLGRHAEAIEALSAYCALEPNDPSGHYSLADSFAAIGEKEKALAAFEQYVRVEKDPQKQARLEKAKKAIEQLRSEVAAAAPAQLGDEAGSSGGAAMATLPGASEAEGGAAAVPSAAAAVGGATVSTAAAAAPAASSVATAPAVAVAPERVALAEKKLAEALELRASGKKRESLFALQDAANADPNNARAVFELGVAYADNYYFPQAIERWQRVLSMNVDDATRAAALANIEKARNLMGGSSSPSAAPSAGATTGVAGTAGSAPSQAQPVVQPPAAAPAAPTPEELYVKGAELYGQQRFAEAIQQFDAAIAAKPDFPQAFTARGSAWFAQREFARALADYSQAMRLDATLASPVLGVAESLNALGRKADAIPYYQAYIASRAADAEPGLQDVARQRLAEIGQ
jgi:tetratricopeptide (TPR) repeat protein